MSVWLHLYEQQS